MWLVVGLGNPGAKYAKNRHNIGFRVVDELARARGYAAWKQKLGAETTSGAIGAEKLALVKPQQFMNLSGHATQQLAKLHAVDIARVIVVHDEIDLDFGVVRVKQGGGHGGHNGLRSIIEQLGGEAGFARIRMGVGRDPHKPPGAKGDAAGWVLSDFPSAQARDVDAMISVGCDAIAAVVEDGVAPAMNRFNTRSKPTPA
jgi:PTH1 family peptidyl-tRNA hydrolase